MFKKYFVELLVTGLFFLFSLSLVSTSSAREFDPLSRLDKSRILEEFSEEDLEVLNLYYFEFFDHFRVSFRKTPAGVSNCRHSLRRVERDAYRYARRAKISPEVSILRSHTFCGIYYIIRRQSKRALPRLKRALQFTQYDGQASGMLKFTLGYVYAYGFGVRPDRGAATQLIREAGAVGIKGARGILRNLSQHAPKQPQNGDRSRSSGTDIKKGTSSRSLSERARQRIKDYCDAGIYDCDKDHNGTLRISGDTLENRFGPFGTYLKRNLKKAYVHNRKDALRGKVKNEIACLRVFAEKPEAYALPPSLKRQLTTLKNNWGWIVLRKERDELEAVTFGCAVGRFFPSVQVIETSQGHFFVVAGFEHRRHIRRVIRQHVRKGLFPKGTFTAMGRNFVRRVWAAPFILRSERRYRH